MTRTTRPPSASNERPPLVNVVLDLATQIGCTQEDGELPTLVIDTSDTRIVITAEAATLPHLSAAADLAEAAERFRVRLLAQCRNRR